MAVSPAAEWLTNIHPGDLKHPLFKDMVKILNVDVKPMGDGQFVIISDINRAVITLETSSGEKRTIKAVAKLEPPPGPGREMANKFNAFTNENLMYSDILKRMEELMSKNSEKSFPWPDCYYASDNKFLIEDLCESGYKIVPTYKFLNLEHSLIMMKALGKFHGLSMIMKENGLLDVTKFKTPMFASKDPMLDKMQEMLIGNMAQHIKDNWEPEWTPIVDRLLKFVENPSEKMHQLWINSKDKWVVINHGDLTMRNMMFHYPPESSQPDGIKFIDFQLCSYSNLGLDVGLILYSSLLPTTRDENMTELLTSYVEGLSNVCRQHGYSGAVPTVEDVKSCLKSLDYLTSTIALFQLPFFLMSEKEDMQEKATEFIETMAGDASQAPPKSPFLDMNHEGVKALIKSELKRCIRENIF